MSTRYQLLFAWSGAVLVVVFALGFWPLAHFVPPLLPSASAVEIAGIYQQNPFQIRLGLFVMMVSFGLVCPFAAVISMQLNRIEGGPSMLSYVQLACGTCGGALVMIPLMLWAGAAFRPERSPELILLLNDMGWITFLWPVPPFFLQVVATGLAILGDQNEQPIFPRWSGFFCLWCAVMFLPGLLLIFFVTGPFAWNGLLTFWLGASVFFTWYAVMSMVLRNCIIRQGQDTQA
ncbi:MAG: hypothetical protein ACI9BW_001521 [Gammaproteobacteria bacterium]|jgi:hypothetical protein